jgi:hypothetical protein
VAINCFNVTYTNAQDEYGLLGNLVDLETWKSLT